MAGRGTGASARGGRWAALTVGDRPYVIILGVLILVAVALALGPLRVFTAAADRVDELEDEQHRLQEEVDDLEDRKRRLEDPDEVERLARSELGLIRPGEIPFVVTQDPDDSELETGEEEAADDAADPWYRRLGRWLGDHLPGGR